MMRDITAERFSLVKTSGIARWLYGSCAKLIFLAFEETCFGEQMDDFAEPRVRTIHKLTEMPAACKNERGFESHPLRFLFHSLEKHQKSAALSS